MHSVNCSVDLDAEALVGYKTIENEQGQATIEFVPGPVTTAMNEGHFYTLTKSIWQSLKPFRF